MNTVEAASPADRRRTNRRRAADDGAPAPARRERDARLRYGARAAAARGIPAAVRRRRVRREARARCVALCSTGRLGGVPRRPAVGQATGCLRFSHGPVSHVSRALVWAYCRVSTRNAEQESSLLEQRSRAEAFAAARTCALHVVEERASAKTLTAPQTSRDAPRDRSLAVSGPAALRLRDRLRPARTRHGRRGLGRAGAGGAEGRIVRHGPRRRRYRRGTSAQLCRSLFLTKSASVGRQADCTFWSFERALVTFSRISLAFAVQMNGFGFAL